MKRLIALFAAIVSVSPATIFVNGPAVHPAAGSPPAYVQSVAAGQNSGPGLVSGALTTTTGHNFYVGVFFDSGATVSSVADAKSNSYTAWGPGKVTDSRNGQSFELFYCENATGGASHTFTVTTSNGDFIRFVVVEVSGALTSSSIDQTGSNLTGSGASLTIATLTPSNNNQLVLGWAMNDGGTASQTFSAGSGFTKASAVSSAASSEAVAEYKQVASATSTAVVITLSGTSQCVGGAVTVKSQ